MKKALIIAAIVLGALAVLITVVSHIITRTLIAIAIKRKGPKSIEDIGNLKSFLEDIFVKKVKAGNKEKADIVLEIFDVYTGFKSLEGFSIKSQMGSASTLFNASKSTNFSYKLQGVTDEIMYQVNTIDTHNKFKDRMKLLRDNNVTFEFCGMRSQVFLGQGP